MKNHALIFLCFFATSIQAQEIILNQDDLIKSNPIHPTTYFIADENQFECNERELTPIYGTKNEIIARVCPKFKKSLIMEGTGVLKDRGNGKITINWTQKNRFKILNQCSYGEGAGRKFENHSNCLLPFFTIATNLGASGFKTGDIIFIPKFKEVTLPDGSFHPGFFEVRDTGGAFKNTGKIRVDLFVGTQNDRHNIFSDAGIKTSKPFVNYEAFLVTGPSKIQIQNFLKEKFQVLY